MEFIKTLGHQKQKDVFLHALREEKLAHAYVLTGPENIGKTTFAREFAGVLGADLMLDVFWHDEEAGLDIETARALKRFLSLRASKSFKVGIISYADRMNAASANCLLKLLEEPPANSIIFLITSNLHALLPTVISRVQRVNFSLFTDEEIVQSLIKINLLPEQIQDITKMSAGRLGIALKLGADQAYYESWQTMNSYYEILAKGNARERVLTSSRLSAEDHSLIRQFIKYAIGQWVSGVSRNNILGSRLMRAWQDMGANLNPKLILDNLFIY